MEQVCGYRGALHPGHGTKMWLLKLDMNVKGKFGSAPRFLCLFFSIVFTNHVTQDVT